MKSSKCIFYYEQYRMQREIEWNTRSKESSGNPLNGTFPDPFLAFDIWIYLKIVSKILQLELSLLKLQYNIEWAHWLDLHLTLANIRKSFCYLQRLKSFAQFREISPNLVFSSIYSNRIWLLFETKRTKTNQSEATKAVNTFKNFPVSSSKWISY